jgi:hypothetical protein
MGGQWPLLIQNDAKLHDRVAPSKKLVGGSMSGFTYTNSALIVLKITTQSLFHRKLATLPEINLSDTNSTYVIIACGIFTHEALNIVYFALLPSILITYKYISSHVSCTCETNYQLAMARTSLQIK